MHVKINYNQYHHYQYSLYNSKQNTNKCVMFVYFLSLLLIRCFCFSFLKKILFFSFDRMTMPFTFQHSISRELLISGIQGISIFTNTTVSVVVPNHNAFLSSFPLCEIIALQELTSHTHMYCQCIQTCTWFFDVLDLFSVKMK